MDLNRREFLALAGATVALRRDGRSATANLAGSLSVVHLEHDYSLESVEGYGHALAGMDPRFGIATAITANRCIRTARQEANRGATVLIEAGLASNAVSSELGVNTGVPLNLWSRRFGPAKTRGAIPYVHYTWPIDAMVRDFSCVVPMSGPGWQAIAYVDGVCVGLTRRLGAGRLVLLGSPLGPVLRGGDREAHEWLAALVDATALPGIARRSPRTAPAVQETAGVRSLA